MNLTAGVGGTYHSGLIYSKNISTEVLDSAGKGTGYTYNYYYSGYGSNRLPNVYQLDGSLEATFPIYKGVEFGIKTEIFNLTDNQQKTGTSRTTWCNADTTTCASNRSAFGAQTSRSQFVQPRNYRITTLIRF